MIPHERVGSGDETKDSVVCGRCALNGFNLTSRARVSTELAGSGQLFNVWIFDVNFYQPHFLLEYCN